MNGKKPVLTSDQYGLKYYMGISASLRELFSTRKPLVTQNNGVQADSYQNLIRDDVISLKNLDITGFSAFLVYSHSIVAGGLEVTSSTTRLTCGTSLQMRRETVSNSS